MYDVIEAELCLNVKAQLGEGAIWNMANNKLYWVDIEGMHFNIFDPVRLENKVFSTNKRIGTVVPLEDRAAVVALEDGIATINIEDGIIQYQVKTEIHLDHRRRFNDGKCDPAGRFWVGTLSMNGTPNVSSLYCFNADYSFNEKISGVSISNGIVWSSDARFMYYIDTPTGEIVRYDFDCEQGHIANKHVIIKIPPEAGFPDGMTIDSEGMLWIALWDGFGVARFDPETGQLLQKISVPAPKVTSCAFGGENLNTLFITTARVEMSAAELEKYPLSGGIFSADANIRGIPAHHFNPLK